MLVQYCWELSARDAKPSSTEVPVGVKNLALILVKKSVNSQYTWGAMCTTSS